MKMPWKDFESYQKWHAAVPFLFSPMPIVLFESNISPLPDNFSAMCRLALLSSATFMQERVLLARGAHGSRSSVCGEL